MEGQSEARFATLGVTMVDTAKLRTSVLELSVREDPDIVSELPFRSKFVHKNIGFISKPCVHLNNICKFCVC
jgi:hypothetical protein